jgi:hypothetical protein
MKFKIWLETEETNPQDVEQPHPFEAWHGKYMDAVKKRNEYNQKMRYRNAPAGLPVPPNADDMLNDPNHSKLLEDVYFLEILTLDSFSSGMHSFGDNDDVPAGNPAGNANLEIKINPHYEKDLVGRKCFVLDRSWGSFHERSFDLVVCAIISRSEYSTFNTYPEKLRPKDYKKITKFFKFQSLKQAIKTVEELEPNLDFEVNDGESREQYWQRIWDAAKANSPLPEPDSGYDSSDAYWKR